MGYEELVELARVRGLTPNSVLFLRSITDAQKKVLLARAAVVVYTPSGEHFGIVPVEAMACRCPVVAVADGGPLESVGRDGSVGVLCEPSPGCFGAALFRLLMSGDGGVPPAQLRESMGSRAYDRCVRLFALPAFANKLEGVARAA